MNTIKNNEHAFPGDAFSGGEKGMSLRDYFAAKAMQGFAASESEEIGHWKSEFAADRAYEWADAMLAARETS